MDRRDAQFFKLLGGARVQSWEVSDVIVRARDIAAVIELAGDGISAVLPGTMSGAFGIERTVNPLEVGT